MHSKWFYPIGVLVNVIDSKMLNYIISGKNVRKFRNSKKNENEKKNKLLTKITKFVSNDPELSVYGPGRLNCSFVLFFSSFYFSTIYIWFLFRNIWIYV